MTLINYLGVRKNNKVTIRSGQTSAIIYCLHVMF